jgi:hypothetical protein
MDDQDIGTDDVGRTMNIYHPSATRWTQTFLAYWAWELSMNTLGWEQPIRQEVMNRVLVPNVHLEGWPFSSVVCPYTFLPSTNLFIPQWLHEHTHITPWVSRNFEGHEYGVSLEGDTGGIQGYNKHEPTCVMGGIHSIRIEPIGCERNTYITHLTCFLKMLSIKVLLCFTIWSMYHFVRTIPYAMLMPSYLFGSFLSHVKLLYLRHEQKVPHDLLGDISLLHLTVSRWYVIEPQGFALWAVRGIHLFLPK